MKLDPSGCWKTPLILLIFTVILAPPAALGLVSSLPALRDWAAANVVPLAGVLPGTPTGDLQAVGEIVGDARLVMLGESRHDAREQFQLKQRVIEYLVEEKGFTLFAMEESLPCAARMNEWLQGGDGDPAALLGEMSAWFIWSTEEVLALLSGLRAYNDDPAHLRKVRFYGLDIMDPLPALADLGRYLDRVDPAAALRWREAPSAQFSPLMWPETVDRYKALGDTEVDEIRETFDDLLAAFRRSRDDYISRSSAAEYEWRLRLALNAKQSNDFFLTSVTDDFRAIGEVRERAMAGNARWLLDERHQGEKMIIWAHNLHVARAEFDLDIPGRPATAGLSPMGSLLAAAYGEAMVAFGFAFARGETPRGPLPESPVDTLDGIMAAAGPPLFALDLRRAPRDGPVGAWLRAPQLMRAEGGHAKLRPARAFDAILFTESITATRPTAAARRRFETIR
jgi:erythromycin esterase